MNNAMNDIVSSAMKDAVIDELMTIHIITVTKDQSLSEVRKVFESENFRHLPVMDGGKMVGVITHNGSYAGNIWRLHNGCGF